MKIDKIPQSILYAVRQNMGAESETDTSYDKSIENLSIDDLVARYCAWHLGCKEWGYEIIGMYKKLKELEDEGG